MIRILKPAPRQSSFKAEEHPADKFLPEVPNFVGYVVEDHHPACGCGACLWLSGLITHESAMQPG